MCCNTKSKSVEQRAMPLGSVYQFCPMFVNVRCKAPRITLLWDQPTPTHQRQLSQHYSMGYSQKNRWPRRPTTWKFTEIYCVSTHTAHRIRYGSFSKYIQMLRSWQVTIFHLYLADSWLEATESFKRHRSVGKSLSRQFFLYETEREMHPTGNPQNRHHLKFYLIFKGLTKTKSPIQNKALLMMIILIISILASVIVNVSNDGLIFDYRKQ